VKSNSLVSPNYIAAKTPSELRRLLFDMQQKTNAQGVYIAMYQDKNTGDHIAWFYQDMENFMLEDAFKNNDKE
jgi:predicted patatin/cPLA2 family phospholipase